MPPNGVTIQSGRPIGLIAGQGHLPVLIAEGVRAAGGSVACVGLAGQYEPELPGRCDRFARAGVIRLGRWVRLLKKWGVRDAVMIGRVRKTRMYDPLRLLRQVPDLRAARLWYRVLRHDKRNATLLNAVAQELARCGINLVDSTRYIPDHLAQEGVLTQRPPTAEQLADADFAWPILRGLNELDIGQSIAVKEREVIAVEAIEGTDALIERAGRLCRTGGWVLVKASKPDQDMRFDVPTVGPASIEGLHQHGASCLVVEAGRVILADKPQVLQLADRLGVCVIGRGG